MEAGWESVIHIDYREAERRTSLQRDLYVQTRTETYRQSGTVDARSDRKKEGRQMNKQPSSLIPDLLNNFR